MAVKLAATFLLSCMPELSSKTPVKIQRQTLNSQSDTFPYFF